jgi:hypothetical protein
VWAARCGWFNGDGIALGWSGVVLAVADFGPRAACGSTRQQEIQGNKSKIPGNEQKETA